MNTNESTQATKISLNPWPKFEKDEITAVCKVLESGKVNYWTGTEVKKFETAFKTHINGKHAIAVANGTLALELALEAINIQPGDEIIVPCRTFIATASAVVAKKGIPVVADVDLNTQNISISTIKPLITQKTKAIICVHLAGLSCDMDPIVAFGKENNIFIIEDCAQSHGAKYKKKFTGTIGDIAAFSFCQDKIMTTGGEGGMVVTNNETLWKSAWEYKDHGKSFDKVFNTQHPPGFRWLHDDFGTNFRMTEMQASIGLNQLKKLSNWLKVRNFNADTIKNTLVKFPFISVPPISEEYYHSYYKFYAFINLNELPNSWTRDKVLAILNEHFVPCMAGSCSEINKELAFQKYPKELNKTCKNGKYLGQTSMMFMVHPTISKEQINIIAKNIEIALSNIN
jgi:dTDP-4-amino-4,6-dideoxygalactose transaminase